MATNIQFHKKMKKLASRYSYLDYNDFVFEGTLSIKGILSIKEIFELFQPDNYYPEGFEDMYEKDKRNYFEEVASLNYEAAKAVYGKDDFLLGEFKVPFYMEELRTCSIEGTIASAKHTFKEIVYEESFLIEKEYLEKYSLNIENGIVSSYSVEHEEIQNEKKLKKYNVSYEHFSSYCVDVGSSKDVLAENIDDAISIVAQRISPPEDGLSWSFSAFCYNDDESYDDESSASYLNAIERPGIAAAEAKIAF